MSVQIRIISRRRLTIFLIRLLFSIRSSFRYLSAYRQVFGVYGGNAIEHKQDILEALEEAVRESLINLPKIPGTTVIAVDESGSMGCPISERSEVRCSDISILLGVIANQLCEHSIVYTFDNNIRELYIPKRNGILDTVMNFRPSGGGTDIGLPFRKMLADKVKCDRVIVISDNECNCDYWGSGAGYGSRTVQRKADIYRNESGCNVWVHAIDLMGYGTQQFAGPRTNIIAGWSEKIFEFILLAEQGEDSLIKRISNYVPR